MSYHIQCEHDKNEPTLGILLVYARPAKNISIEQIIDDDIDLTPVSGRAK
jgi:hypothetical protein